MKTIRRWYIYLVSAISLQAVTWAIIALLRNLLVSEFGPQLEALAFQIAVIIIGLPIFIGHWLWAGRLAAKAPEERGAVLRRLYLYGSLAAFLGPIAANAFDLIGTIWRSPSTLARHPFELPTGQAILYHLIALIVLTLLWFYHQRVLTEESRAVPETDGTTAVRRFYVLAFSGVGLIMTTVAVVQVVRWLMLQLDPTPNLISSDSLTSGLATEITRLLVGVPLWLIFWYRALTLFEGPDERERESAMRKLYLYGAVFIGTLGTVISATAILAGFFRRLLDLPTRGDIRDPLSLIIGLGLVWVYHSLVLRIDARLISEAPRQAEVKRLYLYLVAGVGLAALLVGVSGDISALLRSIDGGFGDQLREEAAWFTAAILAGLPVWLLPWRQVQLQATMSDAAGKSARQSLIRKIYIYFFLFVAAITVLFSAIYIVAGLLNWLLSSEPLTFSELGQAIAFSLIAVGVWLYHMVLLRSDDRLSEREQIEAVAALQLAVVEVADQGFGRAVVEALKAEFPGLALEPVLLTAPEVPLDSLSDPHERTVLDRLAQAKVIVGSWELIVPSATRGAISPVVSQAIMASPARKLLSPTRMVGFEWVGLERAEPEALVKQTVQAIKQMAAGEAARLVRPMGIGTIIAIVIGVFILLISLIIPILSFFSF